MAVVTQDDEGKDPMADDDESSEQRRRKNDVKDEPEGIDYESRDRATPSGPVASGTGFFSVYKPGQGYWTRMGTVGGSAIIVIGIAMFIYREIMPLVLPGTDKISADHQRMITAGVIAGFIIACAIVLWRVLNKPSIVDFFIATESEMKKVNWTTRKELVGSTKVVIVFMFLISAVLFLYDLLFGYLFWIIKVLKFRPF